MKSIKEAANEYAKDYLFSPLAQRTPNTHFEAGANYVLDEIENVINSDRILGNPFPSIKMRYNQIISVIEQLRKPINSRV
jgi:hypothetical protein